MMNYFTFNGIPSYDFGLFVNANGAFSAPSRDVDIFSVAGRNGDLVVDNGRYKNVTATYQVNIAEDFIIKAREIAMWLLADGAYHTLADSFDTTTFRKARFTGSLDYVVNALYETGSATLTFDCMPQRYLVSNTPIDFSANETKEINSLYFTEPLYILSDAGTVTVNGETITATEAVTVDTQRMQCYDGDENKNNSVTLDEFPVLKVGVNSVTSTVEMQLVPNYWKV